MTIGRTNRFLLFAARTFAPAVAVLAVSAAVLTVSSAAAAGTSDPRVCPAASTPAANHAYWCAKNQAVAVVKATMKARQHVAFWSGVYCDQHVSLLRWDCRTFNGGDHWDVKVTFRSTSAGWKTLVSVTKTA